MNHTKYQMHFGRMLSMTNLFKNPASAALNYLRWIEWHRNQSSVRAVIVDTDHCIRVL